jgi:CHAT domain-containing protein
MKPFLIFLFFVTQLTSWGNQVDSELGGIQKALAENRIREAEKLLEGYTKEYIDAQDFLNLSFFIPYAGYVADKNGKNGMDASQKLLLFIENHSKDPRVLRQSYLEIHTYYVEAGKYQLAYEANEKALVFTMLMPDYKPSEWAVIESNLGVISNYLGKPDQAKRHTFRAMDGYNQDPNPPKENIFNLYNDIGVRFWYEAKWDSAEYFWLKGIAYLEEMEPTLTNQYFRKAMINNNLAAVYDVMGNPQESIRRVKMSISLNQYFLENARDDPRYNRAMTSLFYGSANLAAVLKSMGNYLEALHIHEYTLAEKKRRFSPEHPEIIETQIHIGQAHRSLKNYDLAKSYLFQALESIDSKEGGYFIQAADAHYTLGLIFEAEQNSPNAQRHFLLAKDKYQNAFQGKYDYMYLDFLVNASQFFSKSGDSALAISLADEGLNYISQNYGIKSISGINQVINKAQVAYNLGDFKESLRYAHESDQIFRVMLENAAGNMDSIRIEFERPQAILLQVKASYKLEPEKSMSYLKSNIHQLEQALSIMEKRKATLMEADDLAVWVQQGAAINDFLTKLQIELFNKTRDERIIPEILAIQESRVYSRIRSSLQQTRAKEFTGIPLDILEKETHLRSKFVEIFDEEEAVSAYLDLSEEWESLIHEIRANYPLYYQTKFSRISPKDLSLPNDIQGVRYFFVGEELKAVVIANGNWHLFQLAYQKGLIDQLSDHWNSPESLGKICYKLYKDIWQPFEHLIPGERVLIIPDGELFNLSFEMLTISPICSFKDFADRSLLTRYDIHYNISLWLSNIREKKKIHSNYVAFTPGFVDSMKENYLKYVQDSLYLDRAYLSLLPQPFTLNLAENAARFLGGRNYAYEKSTSDVFRSRAGQNKIIHIGTHAESNNLSPAYSRLIFAKPSKPDPSIEENSIFAYEIYNTDMNAHLTVLTACETGKPVYQPGEGMVSLSHAFQYAGSESLLTGLWKIDEKASMEITENFLKNIKSGLAKDKALKQAKLEYLSKAKGRTLSPQYWAGLVLIGDPEPIPGLGNNRTLYHLVIGLILLSVLVMVYSRRKTF